MVNVYTNNGQFNITESLMEAIKANNPELLVENTKEILLEDDLSRKQLKDNWEERLFKKSIENIIRNTKNEKVKSEIRKNLKSKDEDGQTRIDYKSLSSLYKNDSIRLSDETKKLIKKNILNLSKDKEELDNYLHDVKIGIASKLARDYLKNNPEKGENEAKKFGVDYVSDLEKHIHIKDFDELVDDITDFTRNKDREIDDQIEKEKQEKEELDRLRNGVDDAADQILFQQLIKHGYSGLPKELNVNGVILSKKEISQRIKNNKDLQSAWNKYKKSQDNKDLAKQYSDSIQQAEKDLSTLKGHVEPQTLEELLNSQRLINEINSIEQSARILIKKAEKIIPRTLGLFASSSHNAGSDNVANDNIQGRKSQPVDSFLDKKAVNEDINVANDNPNKNIINDREPSKSNLWTGIKNWSKLATGGMVLEPLFDGTTNDKEYFGKALKAYKSYLMDKNKLSLVDNLINELIELHSNKTVYVNKLINEQKVDKNKIEDLTKKLDDVGASFLGNVVFSLKVGNDKNFNDVVRAIRFSDLRELYHVSNEGTVQMLNAKEQNIVFTQDNNVIVGIFIATPILQITRDLFKKASGLMNSFRKAKA